MRIIISGALGRMGRVVAEYAAGADVSVSAGVDVMEGETAFPLYHSYEVLPADAGDVIIDFSSRSALTDLLAYAEKTGIPAVLCSTGYTEEDLAAIEAASTKVALFRSGNMSLGVALLKKLCRIAAQVLGEDYDVEIVEAHHNRKKDAPSGTALMLYDAIKDCYEQPRTLQNGREGGDCQRKHNEIGMHAIRGGTVVGNHDVYFLGNGERITLSHMSENRGLFASGALRAAQFMVGQPAGLYSMEDVLEIH